MENEKVKALSEIQPPQVVVTKVPDLNRSSSSTSSEPDDDREHGYIGSNGSFLESHSENEFTRASSSPYQPPSDEAKEKIRNQVEFYMSDENLSKDAFLLKHVRRHKEGFVNLKLITSFKKVKTLTKDYRVVAESLRQSELLVMNSEHTKVRRKKPLPPELGERNPGRTIVVTQLALDEPSIEKVAEIFSKFGPISVVRIIRSGKNVPPECKHHFVSHPELTKEVCAIVEFETMAAAARACSESKQGEMKVTELIRSNKSTKSKKDKENQPNAVDSDLVKDSDTEEKSGKRRRKKKKDKSGPKRDKRLDELVKGSGDEGHTSSSDNENSFSSFSSYRRRYNNAGSSDGQSPKMKRSNHKMKGSPAVSSPSPTSSPEMRRRTPEVRRQNPGYSSDGSSPSRSPIMQRRLAAQGQSPLAANADHKMVQSLGVLRQPKGPDGTKGFAGRGRMIGVSA